MKTWLRDRGLCAAHVARRAGVTNYDFYRMLNHKKPIAPEVRYTLTVILGMTEQELKEAFA
jgi:hypothetical protein